MNRPTLVATSLLVFAAAAYAGHLLRDRGQHTTAPHPAPLPSVALPAEKPPAPLPRQATFQQLTSSLATTTDTKTLARQFNAIGDDFRRRRLVVLRWAEIDPRSCLDFLVKLPDETGHNSWYSRALFHTWATTDPDAAFANVTAFSHRHNQHTAARAALDGAASADPDHAFARFFAVKATLAPDSSHRPSGWIHENPELALAMIQKHGPDTEWSKDVRGGIAATWAKSDPSAAISWVKANLDALDSQDIHEVTLALNSTDPDTAVTFFTSLPHKLRSPRSAGAIASVLAESDPAKALIWIDDNTLGLPKQRAISEMLDRVARADPAAASLYVEELPASDSSRGTIVARMMQAWTRKSPSDARAWIDSLEPGSLKSQATTQFASGWHKHDPETVIKFIHDNPPEVITKEFLHGILEDDSSRDRRLPEKVAIANSLPEPYAAQLAAPIAAQRSYVDPAAAAQAAILFEHPTARKVAAENVLHGALAKRREAFAIWLAAQPDPATHTLFLDALKNPDLDQARVTETLDAYNAAKAER